MSLTRPITDKLLQLMEDTFGSPGSPDATFKAYYDGDPVYIPASKLPCLIVDKQRTPISDVAPTGRVVHEPTYIIQAEFDKRSEMGKDPDKVVLKETLELLAEGIDSETGEYGEQTIVGVLQRNFTLGHLVTGQNLEVNYTIIPRSQNAQLITEVVSVSVALEGLVEISQRT